MYFVRNRWILGKHSGMVRRALEMMILQEVEGWHNISEEVYSHMWLSPRMPTTSCWITPAFFNTGVFSFCRLYYTNLFEETQAYTMVCICLHVITWTLMLSLERNDSSARCASGGEGNIAATKLSRSNGQHKPHPPSSENLLIQCASKLSGEADQLSHSR